MHEQEFIESADENGIWPSLERFIDEKKFEDFKNGTCYFILPIATTLKTIQRLHDVSEIVCSRRSSRDKIHLNFGKNTVIVLVNKQNISVDGDDYIEKIWDCLSKEQKIIKIKDASASEEAETSQKNIVKYYFEESANWSDVCTYEGSIPDSTDDASDELPLIGTDKTSTIPDIIFEKCNNEENNKKHFKPDDIGKLNKFLGNVTYTHLVNANNHFLFDIDYVKYMKENSEGINKWLGENASVVDHRAFNIIISPLDGNNSEFLNNVISKMFGGNVHLLHFYINESKREEVRVKYSFITKQFKEMKKYFSNLEAHVYFVDTCIISAATLQRAKTFTNMLLCDENGKLDNIEIFKGIITIVNRSSYETISNFLPGHVEDRFLFYSRLNVPSYNTNNGMCPACKYANQYELMHRRSSTNAISQEYRRLQIKHSKKTKYEYNLWLEDNIINSPSYFRWFMQWYYYAVKPFEKTKKYLNIIGEKVPDDKDKDAEATKKDLKTIKKIVKKILENASQKKYTSFKDIPALSDEHDNIIKYFKKYIIQGHYFIRLSCMHQSLSAIENINRKTDTKNKTKEVIIQLLNEVLEKTYKNINEQSQFWLKSEWLNSYFKILSRAPFSASYHARRAIYSILLDLFNGIIHYTEYNEENCDKLKNIIKFISVTNKDNSKNSPGPEIKIKLFTTIVRQLSSMYSPVVLYQFNEIIKYYEKCLEQFDSSKYNFYMSANANLNAIKYISMPSHEKFSYDITKLIKWSAMSSFDESKCFAIEYKFINYDETNYNITNKENKEWGKILFLTSLLENTFVIYSGIKSIYEQFHHDLSDKEKLREDIENIYYRIRKYKKENVSYEESKHNKIINYLDVNTVFMRFMDLRPNNNESADTKIIELYTNMCLYFSALQSLVDTKGPVEDPYTYIDICNYMRDIAGYEQCKVVSSLGENDLTELVTSDINEKFFASDLSQDVMKRVIYKFRSKNSDMLEGTVQKFGVKNNKVQFEMMVISIPLHSSDKPSVFILLYKDYKGKLSFDNDIEPQQLFSRDIWCVRNILFLRDKLGVVFSRDIIALTKTVYNYKYIKPLQSNKRIIMHISDLHITQSNKDKYIDVLNNNKLMLNQIKPDLLLITGDVITGGYDATSINKNYAAARDFINKLAFYLWKDTDKNYIRSDWRKRILITTGNHDYASMNELHAHNRRRTTISGKPSDTIGTTMIKYSYFMNFMHTLLGTDVDDMVLEDLNSFTYFQKLGVSVMNINTNSGVNPFRTNKVRINERAVSRLAENNKELSENMIYIMHHTPIYEIDYVYDVYYIKNSETRKEIKAEISNIKSIKDENENKIWIMLIKALIQNFNTEFYGLNKDRQEELFIKILKIIKNTDSKSYEKNNLSDFVYFLTVDSEERQYDDRCLHIQSGLEELIRASENDIIKYSEFFKKYFAEDSKPFYVLGGHTHVNRKYNDESDKREGVLKNCLGIYEQAKFVNDEHLSYGILQYNIDPKIMQVINSSYDFNSLYTATDTDIINTVYNITKKDSAIIKNLTGHN